MDRVETAIFAARLTIADWLYGPAPMTGDDRERERRRNGGGQRVAAPYRKTRGFSAYRLYSRAAHYRPRTLYSENLDKPDHPVK